MKINIILLITILLNLYISDYVFAEDNPNILSEAAILIDSQSGEVLYEKNSNKKMYPASLTKIATAIYALEKGNLDDLVTVSKKARQVDGTRVYLEEGEEVSLKKLIQGLLINSGNDAGVAIAEHLGGSVEKFSAKINSYLRKEVGLDNTNFENPHGLFSPTHVTTAEDLAKLTKYAMRNEEFMRIFGTEELKWEGSAWNTTLFSHHKLMREQPYEGITGGKTGFVEQSGFTLITTAKRGNTSLIVVVLKGPQQQSVYNDTIKLLDYGFSHYKTSIIPKDTVFTMNENKFIVEKDFYYTYLLKDKVVKRVSENGILKILNSKNELLTSIKLAKIEEISVKSELKKEKVANKDKDKDKVRSYLSKALIISIGIICVLIILKKLSIKRKQKSWM